VKEWCEHVGGKYDSQQLCGNKARYRVVATGRLLCGRHIRHAGKVTELPRLVSYNPKGAENDG
jgi:hypothetical protein